MLGGWRRSVTATDADLGEDQGSAAGKKL